MKRTLSHLGLTLAATLALAGGVRAQTTLIDDFNDGNDLGWSHTDFTLGLPWGPAIFDASSGALHMQATGLVPVDDPNVGFMEGSWEASGNNPRFANGYVRGAIRADTAGTTCGYLMRTNDDTGSDYGFYGSSSFGTFYIERFDPTQPIPQTIIAIANPALIPFHAGETWNIECGVVGHTLTLKAWRVGALEPKAPTLIVQDSAYRPHDGTEICAVAFFDPAAVTAPVQVSATFDNITFSHRPGP